MDLSTIPLYPEVPIGKFLVRETGKYVGIVDLNSTCAAPRPIPSIAIDTMKAFAGAVINRESIGVQREPIETLI